jgi:hypothetical protein
MRHWQGLAVSGAGSAAGAGFPLVETPLTPGAVDQTRKSDFMPPLRRLLRYSHACAQASHRRERTLALSSYSAACYRLVMADLSPCYGPVFANIKFTAQVIEEKGLVVGRPGRKAQDSACFLA